MENVHPPVVLSSNTVHPVPELQPRPSDPMDVDTPTPAGVKVESPPSPPPPPPRGNREFAPPPPPGNPATRSVVATQDDVNYHSTHANLWHELQSDTFDNNTRHEKTESFLAWKVERGFVKARDWTRCPFELYLHQGYPPAFDEKQKESMYETSHVNDPHCRAILRHIIEGGVCAKRGCPRQIKFGFVHCCNTCCKGPNDVV